MIPFKDDFESQNSFFNKHKVKTCFPGFYDDPNFLSIENIYPHVLNNYASFVKQQRYDSKYLKHAKQVIDIVVQELHNELKKDGRKGACVDASLALSRILEKEGIWNYLVSGSLTMTFSPESGITKKYFWSIDHGKFSAAHAWLVAPPYKIVDLTIKEQPYKQGEEFYLPSFILQENTIIQESNLEDIIEPNILRSTIKEIGNNKKNILELISPNQFDFCNFFHPESFQNNKVNFKYTPTAISASDVCLEEITSLKLNNMYSYEIYNKIIKPKLP